MTTAQVNEQLQALIGVPDSRWRIPTPALIVDVEAFSRNVAKMAARARDAGVALRPHAKTHKSSYVARAQLAAGAVGICCAKLGEAEALMGAGVRGVLVTSPIAGVDVAARAARLAHVDPTFAMVVDHVAQVDLLGRATRETGVSLQVLIDLDVGLTRTGASSVEQALAIADRIHAVDTLRLRGVQGYGGHWQHIKGRDARRDAVRGGMQRVSAAVEALRARGCRLDVVTGGGTGSFAADVELKTLTELQPGSYPFMDSQYRDALEHDADGEFEHSLFVQARVISVNAGPHVTIDAGLKAFATDGPLPRPTGERFGACTYGYFGDEHGRLTRPANRPVVELDERVELVPPHCDPTVDRYQQYILVRGDTVVGVAPIEAGRCSA